MRHQYRYKAGALFNDHYLFRADPLTTCSPTPSLTHMIATINNQPAGLLRRLGALLYDSLLLFGVMFFATLLLLVVRRGAAITPGDPFFAIYLFAIGFLFFGWFWTRGGQTLGMRAWRIRVLQCDGTALTWTKALQRYLLAWVSLGLLGLGFFWLLVGKDRQTLHDRWSGTVVVCTDLSREPGVNM